MIIGRRDKIEEPTQNGTGENLPQRLAIKRFSLSSMAGLISTSLLLCDFDARLCSSYLPCRVRNVLFGLRCFQRFLRPRQGLLGPGPIDLIGALHGYSKAGIAIRESIR